MDSTSRWTIVMAPARSGSTWLFDDLRAHPRARFRPDADFFRLLEFDRFNRFPRDLCDRDDSALRIELRPGVEARIPDIAAPDELRAAAEAVDTPTRWIEKVHPEMFRFDTTRALDGFARVERETGALVEIVYRLRRPIETIRSVVGYKRRNPSWYEHLPECRVVSHVESSLAFLCSLMDHRPGLVIDHREQTERPPETLERVYNALWPEIDPDIQRRLSIWATKHSANRAADRENTRGFFAPSKQDDDEAARLASLISDHRDSLERCERHYESLTNRPASPAPASVG